MRVIFNDSKLTLKLNRDEMASQDHLDHLDKKVITVMMDYQVFQADQELKENLD